MSKIRKIKKIINLLILFSLLLNTFFISGCIDNSNIFDNRIDNDIVIGMTQDISGFYPWIGIRDISTLSVNKNLFNSLVELDAETYDFNPALAERWNNPDNVTWRFFLRNGVKFHNGNIFTAEDVKFTIEYMKNYTYYNEELAAISEIVILNNYTIDIITDRPYPILLYKLITLYILSKNYMTNIAETNETWPIGTGAYQLVEYTPEDHITLKRFDNYWKGQPEVDNVIFKKMNDSEELRNALINRELDIIPLRVEDVEEIQNIKGFIVKSVQTPGVNYLSFDFRENDSYGFKDSKNPVADVRVRKAMYHAIDIDIIIKKYLNGSATSASQFLTYHTFGYNPNITRLPYDINIAKELMREAGYIDGFTIELDIPNSSKWLNISNEIANQLSKINITIILNPQLSSDYYSKLYQKNTSLYITGFSPLDAEGLIKLLLHTPDEQRNNGVWNYGNYSNHEVDRLCDILSYTMDVMIRKEYIQEIFSIATADVAWIPLFSYKAFYGMLDYIKWNPRPSLYIWVEEISF